MGLEACWSLAQAQVTSHSSHKAPGNKHVISVLRWTGGTDAAWIALQGKVGLAWAWAEDLSHNSRHESQTEMHFLTSLAWIVGLLRYFQVLGAGLGSQYIPNWVPWEGAKRLGWQSVPSQYSVLSYSSTRGQQRLRVCTGAALRGAFAGEAVGRFSQAKYGV